MNAEPNTRSSRIPEDVIRVLQASIDNPVLDSETPADFRHFQDDVDDCIAMLAGEAALDTTRYSHSPTPSLGTVTPHAVPHQIEPTLREFDVQRFRFSGVLGAGGFGVVLGVHDLSIMQKRALKILRPSLSSSRSLFRRFLREIEIASRLRHDGIVRVFETGLIQGRPCILSAQIEGPSLSELITESGGTLDTRLAVQIIAQVADALDYAHERGVLHRDLKPGNILLQTAEPTIDAATETPSYEPKLTDFGLAKQFDEVRSGDESLSAHTELLGTPRYMSPEQAAGRHGDVGVCSDIYSLGAILYRCLTAKAPFEGSTASEMLLKIQAGGVDRPAIINKSISPDLENVILKCLAMNPHDRYRSASELATDLRRYLRGEPVSARRATVLRRIRHWSARNPKTALLTFSLVLSAALSIGLSWRLYLASRSEATANERMLRVAFQAVNDAYVDVAEKMLNSVPNSLEEQYRLHQRALEAHRKIAEEFNYNALSRYRLSIQYSYLGRSAARLFRFEEAAQHFQECLNILTVLIKESPDNTQYRYDMFFNRKCLADMKNVTDREKGQALIAVLREISQLSELDNDNPDFLDAKAASLFALGEFLNFHGDTNASESLTEAIRISDQLQTSWPNKPLYGKYAILGRAELASYQIKHGRPDLALTTCQHALQCHATFPLMAEQPFINSSLLRNLYFTQLQALLALQKWSEAVDAAEVALESEARTEVHMPHESAYEYRRCQILISLLTARLQLGATEAECQDVLSRIQASLERWEAAEPSAAEISEIRSRLREIDL